jgi:hypothetical protein
VCVCFCFFVFFDGRDGPFDGMSGCAHETLGLSKVGMCVAGVPQGMGRYISGSAVKATSLRSISMPSSSAGAERGCETQDPKKGNCGKCNGCPQHERRQARGCPYILANMHTDATHTCTGNPCSRVSTHTNTHTHTHTHTQ